MSGRKWYHRIAFYLNSLTPVNAFTPYHQVDDKGSFLDFQIDIRRCLIKAEKESANDDDIENQTGFQRSLKAKHIPDQICFDRVNDWPIKTENPKLWKQVDCTKRNCFICAKFH